MYSTLDSLTPQQTGSLPGYSSHTCFSYMSQDDGQCDILCGFQCQRWDFLKPRPDVSMRSVPSLGFQVSSVSYVWQSHEFPKTNQSQRSLYHYLSTASVLFTIEMMLAQLAETNEQTYHCSNTLYKVKWRILQLISKFPWINGYMVVFLA